MRVLDVRRVTRALDLGTEDDHRHLIVGAVRALVPEDEDDAAGAVRRARLDLRDDLGEKLVRLLDLDDVVVVVAAVEGVVAIVAVVDQVRRDPHVLVRPVGEVGVELREVDVQPRAERVVVLDVGEVEERVVARGVVAVVVELELLLPMSSW